METRLNRRERRRLEQKARHLIQLIDSIEVRRELLQLVQALPYGLIYTGRKRDGKDFSICITPDGIRYGEREKDRFCVFEDYGPRGEHLFSWSGDGIDLLEGVPLSQ